MNRIRKQRDTFGAEMGGLARAEKYCPEQLSKWASMGGKAVLAKYGNKYFKKMRQQQDRSSIGKLLVYQPSPRQVATQMNGKIGGNRRAQLYSPAQLRGWASLGGQAVNKKYGSEHFRKLRAIGIQKQSERLAEMKKRWLAGAAELRARGDELVRWLCKTPWD